MPRLKISKMNSKNKEYTYLFYQKNMFQQQPQDNREFMGIKLREWPEDRLFVLFLKYKINEETSLRFVQDFLKDPPAGLNYSRYTVRDKNLGISLETLLEKKEFGELKEPEHFMSKVEKVYPKDVLMRAMKKFFIKSKDKIPDLNDVDINTIMKDFKDQKENILTFHVTVDGLVKMMSMESKYITPEMKIHFKKLIMWAAVMTDTDGGKNFYGTV